ncbi:MAG: hypothetical protein ACPG19_13445 [Saprospiraceae bacterium]
MSSDILHIKSISQLHEAVGAPKPKHPLISILDYSKMKVPQFRKKLKSSLF